jgi:deoxyribonuclease-4
MRVGFHVSILGSIDEAVDRAVEMEINTFQMFTRNPRGWQFTPITPEEVNTFEEKLAKVDISPIFVHMPYLPNLASPRSQVYNLSVRSLTEELKRCDKLNVPFLVTHLGSHLGSGKAAGLKRITDAIDGAFSEIEGEVMLLLENTAGTKNSMGSSFEDIRKVVDGVTSRERVGICLDVCHAFAAGYDLRGERVLENTLRIFDSVLGLKRLKLVHLNDSIGGLRSHIDRHEHIGLGKIGEEGFRTILSSELRKRPMIMETPVDERRSDLENLMKVRDLVNI